MHYMTFDGEDFIKREKQKSRQLKKTRWWRQKLSAGGCYYCHRPCPPGELTMDHIIPLSLGGMSLKSNIVAACKDCNNKKKNHLPHEWKEYMDRLDRTAYE